MPRIVHTGDLIVCLTPRWSQRRLRLPLAVTHKFTLAVFHAAAQLWNVKRRGQRETIIKIFPVADCSSYFDCFSHACSDAARGRSLGHHLVCHHLRSVGHISYFRLVVMQDGRFPTRCGDAHVAYTDTDAIAVYLSSFSDKLVTPPLK